MTINSRNKGAGGERELARILKEHGFNTWRGQQYSGANGDADIEGLMDVHLEVKRVEKLNIHKAMEQSRRDAAVNKEIPVVVHRKNRTSWLVTMDLIDWIEFYKGYEKVKDGQRDSTDN